MVEFSMIDHMTLKCKLLSATSILPDAGNNDNCICVVLHHVYTLHSYSLHSYMPAAPVSSALKYHLVMAAQQASRCFTHIGMQGRCHEHILLNPSTSFIQHHKLFSISRLTEWHILSLIGILLKWQLLNTIFLIRCNSVTTLKLKPHPVLSLMPTCFECHTLWRKPCFCFFFLRVTVCTERKLRSSKN